MSCQTPRDFERWTSFTPGTLQLFADRHRAVRRQEAVRRVITPSIILVALTLGVWTTSRIMQHSESSYGGISCLGVQANMTLYASGLLSNEMSEKMSAHLRECSYCRSHLRALSRKQPNEVGKTPRYDYSIVASVSPFS